jgi:hypothetical protein
MGRLDQVDIDDAAIAAELLRRRRARRSMVAFAKSIEVPGKPLSEDQDADVPDWLFKPIESDVADLHVLMCEAIQQCIEEDDGRLMLFFPPGSAKSTYASVVAPAWAMGDAPRDVIVVSYSSTPAERCSRRIRAIVGQPGYTAIWPNRPMLTAGNSAVGEWTMSNGSRLLASGILGSVTSARADVLIIDDPVSGREDADSEPMRRKTRQAYDDDLRTRMKPGCSIILMMTRWHLDDLAGSILPEDYAGQSGKVLCRDGKVWTVLNVPAKAEHLDDPLGRDIGEYLWPEWFKAAHWQNFEPIPGSTEGPDNRTWAALYQQRPTFGSGGKFEQEWFRRHDAPPAGLTWYGASDWAVTKKTLKTHPDFTEHGLFGVDKDFNVWIDEWWYGQVTPATSIAAWLAMLGDEDRPPQDWLIESGVIKNAMQDALKVAQESAGTYVTIRSPSSLGDKVANSAAFAALAQNGKISIRKGAWGDRLIAMLCSFPFGRYDDAVDVCGLIGRMITALRAYPSDDPEPKKKAVKPFTEEHFEMADDDDNEDVRRRYLG